VFYQAFSGNSTPIQRGFYLSLGTIFWVAVMLLTNYRSLQMRIAKTALTQDEIFCYRPEFELKNR